MKFIILSTAMRLHAILWCDVVLSEGELEECSNV